MSKKIHPLAGTKVYVVSRRWNGIQGIFITKECAEKYMSRRGNQEYLELTEHRLIDLNKDCQV